MHLLPYSPFIPFRRVHHFPSEFLQTFNIRPRRRVEITPRTDYHICLIMESLTSREILHCDIPFRQFVVPCARFDLML
jgi:hypothetical protein